MGSVTVTRPMPPAHLLQRISNNPSAEDFIRSFPFLRHSVRSYLDQAGYDFASFHNILDFGCGVGRFMFAFQQELGPHQRIWGCEVHGECARWCQENIDFAETVHNPIDPPLPYDDRQFDLVYALSVYTHLRLDMQFRWAWEIHRVLRPGGVLFATIHGPLFFPFFHGLRNSLQRDAMYSFGDNGLFAYLAFPSPEGLDQGQVQVASAHNPDFFRQQFSAFEIVKRFPQSMVASGQDVYIIRKPVHGRPVGLPAASPNITSWSQPLEPVGAATPVQLIFHLDGHERFHVYPSVQKPGIFLLGYHIEVRAGDRILVAETIRPPHNRMMGRTHHAILEMTVPSHHGEVSVLLSAEVTHRGLLSDDEAPEVSWRFPHFT